MSTTVGGATILTSDSTLSVDWSNDNRPAGLDDGDDNDSLDTPIVRMAKYSRKMAMDLYEFSTCWMGMAMVPTME